MGHNAAGEDQAMSELREKHRVDLERLTLTSRPFKTMALFVLAIGQSIRSTCSCVLKEGARLKFLGLLFVATWVLLLVTDGPHEKHMQELIWYVRFGLWWVILGVASSIGLGSGLHTFVLYLGPHIALFTIKAVRCGRLDLKSAPYGTILLKRRPSWLEKDCLEFGPPIYQETIPFGKILHEVHLEGERYFLRVLLNHVRGPTSYEDLKTVAGIICPTFRESCENRGLIETDKTLDDCLCESATFQMPYALRRLFATILVFCEATKIRELWEKHKESMSEDYLRNHCNSKTVEQMVLRDIRDLRHSMGKDMKNYDLPELNDTGEFSNDIMREVREELSVGVDQEHLDIKGSLNKEQRAGFLVYNFLKSWNGERLPFINTISHSLRTEFLVDILKSSGNECTDIIPGELQDLLKQFMNYL